VLLLAMAGIALVTLVAIAWLPGAAPGNAAARRATADPLPGRGDD
jgi:hypothetical protein